MEKNKFTDIIGVVTTEAITEGRFVLLTPANANFNYGSRSDLMGVKLPANSTEAARARYCLAFALDNRPTPLMEYPSYPFAMRQGYDLPANVPFTATVYLTHPGNMTVPQVIASGSLALAYDKGVFTLPSGSFIASASWAVAANFVVANLGDDATDVGKPKYSASAGIGIVENYDATNQTLTVRTL
jgi:hypothetical protein